jgi:transcriptional regulator with XRE-family HTH domain
MLIKELRMTYQTMSDAAILKEFGARLRRVRLNRNLTQSQLAERAGIGRRTIQKAEDGEVTTLATVIAMLRGLDLLSQLDKFLPEPPLSPTQLARMQGRKRRRASNRRRANEGSSDWTWGE